MGEDGREHLEVLAKVQRNYAIFLKDACLTMGIELPPEKFRDVVYSMTVSVVEAIEIVTGDNRFSAVLKQPGFRVTFDEKTGEIIGHGSP